MRGDVLGFERRRRWSDEAKLGIVTSVGVGGATVAQVAQRHDVTRQQVYAWRHELRRKGLWSPDGGALFLPVDVSGLDDLPAVTASREAAVPTPIELRLCNGRCLCFDSSMDAGALTRLIRAVEAA